MKSLTRAAIFFAGAVSASACGNGAEEPNSETTQGEPSDVQEEPEAQPGPAPSIYGSPPVPDEDVTEDEPIEEESMMGEAYGAPPPPPEE